MNLSMLKCLFIMMLCSLSCITYSKENVREVLTADNTQFSYFAINSRELSISQVEHLSQDKWVTNETFNPYGLIHQNYWLHFTIQLDAYTDTEDLYLEASNPLIDQLDVYFIRGNQRQHFVDGDMVDSVKQTFETPIIYFPIPNSHETTLNVYIKYQDQLASFLPLAITNSKESFETIGAHGMFSGIIIGLLSLLLLMNIILNRAYKQSIYHYFSGFILIGGIIILALEGVASVYLWPAFPWLQNQVFPTLFLLSIWFSIQLTRQLTQPYLDQHQTISAVLRWLSLSILIIAPVLFALPAFVAGIVSVVCLCVAVLIMSVALFFLTVRARVFQPLLLSSWAAFIISLMLMTTYFAGIIAMPPFMLTVATLSYSLQFILWGSLILSRFISTKENTLVEQHLMIDELNAQSKHQEELMSAQQEEHLDLEAQFNERSFELNVTLRELQETNRQLEEQATNDALTGVKNRKFFDERLLAEYRLSRRQQTPLSLLLLDADKFKLVNDNHGHLAGDKVLIEISKIASRVLKRPNDYVCRYGGEEFAILLSNTDQKGATKVAEVIRQKIANTAVTTDKIELQVTVSIGVSSMLVASDSPDSQLFEQADQALYHAKESGRNNVKTFEEFTNSAPK